MRARLALALSTVLLAGCGSSGSSGAGASSDGSPALRSELASSPTSATSSGPVSLVDRCGSVAAGARRVSVGVAGQRLSAAERGTGAAVAVLLHQTNGDGLCGWTSGAKLFADKGIRTLSLDLCGYGESTCTLTPTQQVRGAVAWAKARGATRVGVVGASMGGSIALGTARTSGADVTVDLSGPTNWSDVPEAKVAAKGLSTPLLVAASKDDTDTDAAGLRAATATASGPHRFVSTPTGHGWDLVSTFAGGADRPTPLFATIVSWLRGDYVGG
ncbi:alpha/beta hydrolase family protein [Flexivirga meconopsidis]|uniref:alpha/beta hydrolase family protein n=1 Tax=Flexivirga meconopsidis TaxID=2977121 RepID=UPI00223F2F1D|nr:dienelactone hydrolase family protein [Flexivirga meconopsidis]